MEKIMNYDVRLFILIKIKRKLYKIFDNLFVGELNVNKIP